MTHFGSVYLVCRPLFLSLFLIKHQHTSGEPLSPGNIGNIFPVIFFLKEFIFNQVHVLLCRICSIVGVSSVVCFENMKESGKEMILL